MVKVLLITAICTAGWLGKSGHRGMLNRGNEGCLIGPSAILDVLSLIGVIIIAIFFSIKLNWWWFLLVGAIYFVSALISIILTIPLGVVARIICKSPDQIKNTIDYMQIILSLILFVVGWLYLIPEAMDIMK